MLKAHEISRRAEALAEEHRMQEVARTVEFSRGVERYIANHKVKVRELPISMPVGEFPSLFYICSIHQAQYRYCTMLPTPFRLQC